jgi:hypothetical protein
VADGDPKCQEQDWIPARDSVVITTCSRSVPILAKGVVREGANDVAVSNRLADAAGRNAFELRFEPLQSHNACTHRSELIPSNPIRVGARSILVAAEIDQLAYGLDAEAEIAGVSNERQALQL